MNENVYTFEHLEHASAEALRQIVALHAETFPAGIMRQLGEPFLNEYYTTLIESDLCGIIVCKQHNQVVGYIAYTANNACNEIRGMMQKYKKRMLRHVIAFRVNPIMLVRAWLKKQKSKQVCGVAELTAFSVAQQHRRMGIGKQLLNQLEAKFHELKQTDYIVFTDNEEGLRFYQKEQFETVFQFRLFGVTSACFKKKVQQI